MKKFSHILKYIVSIGAFMVLSFPALAEAQLIVDFQSVPLFEVENFLPGDSEGRTVKVTNDFDAAKAVYTEAINVSDPDNLGSEMKIEIREGAVLLYNDSFSDFLSGGLKPLSTLSAHSSTTYTYKIFFLEASTENQGSTLGFDLCLGISGGNFQCGDTLASDLEIQNPGDGPGNQNFSTTQGGGASSNANHILSIFNEEAETVVVGEEGEENSTVQIEWDTNILATSQVVYGLKEDGPYFINLLDLPNLGYPKGTVEDSTKVLHHTVLINGLISGEVYVFRMVSRASPPTISFEREFSTIKSEALAYGGTQNTFSIGGNPSLVYEAMGSEESATSGEKPSISNEGSTGSTDKKESDKGSSLKNSDFAAGALLGIPDAWFELPVPVYFVILFIVVAGFALLFIRRKSVPTQNQS